MFNRKEYMKDYSKNYYRKNKERFKIQSKVFHKKNTGYMKNYREKTRDRVNEWLRERYAKKREWFDKYKTTLKCKICGENHIACIEFHHRDPSKKKYSISKMVAAGMKKNRILKEIKKCNVLCKNSHKPFCPNDLYHFHSKIKREFVWLALYITHTAASPRDFSRFKWHYSFGEIWLAHLADTIYAT